MTRGIWTKWIVGAAFVLLIIAVGCIWYYQQTTAQDREQAAQAEKQLQQWKANKEQKPTIKTDQESTETPAENTTSTTEKPINETTPVTDKIEPRQAQVDAPAQNTEAADVPVLPFGPYPEVPEDYFRRPSWLRYSNFVGRPEHEATAFEIMDRVLIKLWNQGHKNITGASFSGGKVYPHYANTAYVRYEETILPDGTVYRRVTRVKGGPDIGPFAKQIKKGNTPAHIKLLDYDSAGINPFTFLKGED